MYVGVDIGGTKTLLAVFDAQGEIKERALFPTTKNYNHFILELKHKFAHLAYQDFKAGAIGVRGVVDREHGCTAGDNVLPWAGKPLQANLENIMSCPMAIENDAKLAGLSEAILLSKKYKRVVYVTISTGIGFCLVVDGVIDINTADLGGQTMMLEHKGKFVAWEDFAGGKAIVERYGKKAMDIKDDKTWQAISRDLARGYSHLISMLEPEVIVTGGAVGEYFERYYKFLKAEIDKYRIPIIKMPHLIEAHRPTEAVIYGCYELAKQRYGHGKIG